MSRPQKMHEPLDFDFDEVLTAIADENKPEYQAPVARPFLKWVGGKRSILPELASRMPESYTRYFEPFMGGGALYFSERPHDASLSDVNFVLVLAYVAVRDHVEDLIAQLQIHEAKHSKEYYLAARKKLAHEKDGTKVGALLIYLNKTCYNGLYRVNKAGEYNVPIGSYTKPAILDAENLRACSAALAGVTIEQRDFAQTPIQADAFYYIDPPYHKTFSSYDGSGFGDSDHEKLAEFCKLINAAGGKFMVSNSDTPFVRKLYKGYTIEEVEAGRYVSCKGHQRGKETELVIRNFSGRKSG